VHDFFSIQSGPPFWSGSVHRTDLVKIRPISRGLPGQQGVFHSWSKLDLDEAREPESRLRAGAELCQGRPTPPPTGEISVCPKPAPPTTSLVCPKPSPANWPVRVCPKMGPPTGQFGCVQNLAWEGPRPPPRRPQGQLASLLDQTAPHPKAHPANWRAPGAARTHLSPAGDRPSPPRRLASPPDGATRAPWGPPVHRPPPSARRCRGP
jgi:hypothetical protein